MKNYKIVLLFMLLIGELAANAQIRNEGAKVKILGGTYLKVTGNLTNTNAASAINNEGIFAVNGHLNNSNSGNLDGNGTYKIGGDWTNAANFTAGTSDVRFDGTTGSLISSGNAAFYNLTMDKTNADATLSSDVTVNNILNFNAANNKLILGNNDLTIGATASLTNFDNTRFVVTNNRGKLLKKSLGTDAFTYPVGFNATTYNPLSIVQNGTVDDIGARCLEHVFRSGTTGNSFTYGVADVSWDVTEANSGGSNLTLMAQWLASDELNPMFNRNDCAISRFNGTNWDATNAMMGSASIVSPYTRTRSGIMGVGVFAVGSEPTMKSVMVSLKTYLQGAYSGSGLMTDNLRSLSLIPTTEPYTGLSYTQIGRGGGEQIAPSVFTPTGNDAVVDWVLVELRDKNTSATVIQTKSALIQRDGDIVDLDGISPLAFPGIDDDNYYVSIKHRNHLAIRTPSVLSLSTTATTAYEFTSAASKALNGIQATLSGGYYGMYGGNANGNTTIRYGGVGNDNNTLLNTCLSGNKSLIISNSYSPCDLNMNGTIRYGGVANDNNVLLNTVLGGNKSLIITQPTF